MVELWLNKKLPKTLLKHWQNENLAKPWLKYS